MTIEEMKAQAKAYLNPLSDSNLDVFNFVAKVKYEDNKPSVQEIAAAAEWIDREMRRRHEVGKQGGRPREKNVSAAALYQRERRARKKSE